MKLERLLTLTPLYLIFTKMSYTDTYLVPTYMYLKDTKVLPYIKYCKYFFDYLNSLIILKDV